LGGNDNIVVTMDNATPSQQYHHLQQISNEQYAAQRQQPSSFRRRRRNHLNSIPMIGSMLAVGALCLFLSIINSVGVVVHEKKEANSQTIQIEQQSWYDSILKSSRRLWSLSDEEVQDRLFQRHHDPPPTRSAITTAPVVGGLTPTTAPVAIQVPSVTIPSTPTIPTIPTIGSIPTVPTIIKVPTLGATPTIPKIPSITSKPDGTVPTLKTVIPSGTAMPTKDGGAKIPPIPFGQIGPTVAPVSNTTNSPADNGVMTPTAIPNLVPTTITSVQPVPTIIQQTAVPISIDNNETSSIPSTGVPTLAPNLNSTITKPPSFNSNGTSDAPSLVPMNGANSDRPSLSPLFIPDTNGTTVSPIMVPGNDSNVPSMSPNNNSSTIGNETRTPSMSPNANISSDQPVGGNISLLPTPIETTLRFLERSLQLDDGIISQSGTYQNMAYTTLMANFPNFTPMNGNQMEIIQIFALNTIYYSLNGTKWRTRTGWTGPMEPCGGTTNEVWYGVTCSTGSVTKIDLSENDLLGDIPSEIKGLSSLGTSYTGRPFMS
jgi:hypothetical protein